MTAYSTILHPSIESSEQVGTLHGTLHPAEAVLLGTRANSTRQAEFAAGRTCARQCLTALGAAIGPILRGHAGQPIFPVGFVGSITHCDEYCAAAVASSEHYLAIGIDAAINQLLAPEIVTAVGRPSELAALPAVGIDTIHWPTLLFSIKEAVGKALFFVRGNMPTFHQLEVHIDAAQGRFTAAFSVDSSGKSGADFKTNGNFRRDRHLLLTACSIPRQ